MDIELVIKDLNLYPTINPRNDLDRSSFLSLPSEQSSSCFQYNTIFFTIDTANQIELTNKLKHQLTE